MTKPIAILIDDEPDIRELLAISLKRAGMDCVQAGSYSEGINLISSTSCDLCITDVRMPDGSGLELVKQFKAAYPDTPIAVMTAFDTTDIAVQAMKSGAFDFLAKPIRAKRLESLLEDLKLVSTAKTDEDSTSLETIIGDSDAIQKVREHIALAANSLAPVVIQGEQGTGKELTARNIHDQSARRYGPFISIDCSALREDLLESEFFGHEKNSFDRAIRKKSGFLKSAQGGTLYLDEISALPVHFQLKLLQALEERRYTPLGAKTSEPNEIRVITSTRSNLNDLVNTGALRADLYYYLNVLELNIPALRDYLEDIEALCEHLLNGDEEEEAVSVSPEVLHQLKRYTFPGNLRELENILRRARAVCTQGKITEGDISFSPIVHSAQGEEKVTDPLKIDDLEGYMDKVEHEIISAVLESEKWNRTKAAKRLGLSTRQFRYKLSKYGFNNKG